MPIPIHHRTKYICDSMIFGRKSSSAVEADLRWKGEKCPSTMHHSFHHALSSCSAALPPGKRYVAVEFLTKELIFYVIDVKEKGQEVFDEASKHIGLPDAELFGLAINQDGEYIFLDLNLKISKYAAKSWKNHNDGLGSDGQPLLILYLRVKYYVDFPLLINEKVVRHHYYLQLRENIRNYFQPLTEERAFVLAALALQADLGNFDEEKYKDRYFAVTSYFPSWMIQKLGEDFICRHIPSLHRDNVSLSRAEAQVGYIQEASTPTAPHNLHLYKMRRKKGKLWTDVWLGIGDAGLHIYEQGNDNTKKLLSTFLWCDIAKLHFEKKKFEILSEGSPVYRRFTYLAQSEDMAKYMLWICRTTHFFHMSNQARVADLKKLELDGGKQYREAYIYTDKFDQAREKQQSNMQKNLQLRNGKMTSGSTLNLNGMNGGIHKPQCTKMFSLPWSSCNGLENGPSAAHHSMEVLPVLKDNQFSSKLQYKSRSIPCLPESSMIVFSEIVVDNARSTNNLYPQSDSTTPCSTLEKQILSNGSCTDSTCSTLSLPSSSMIKSESPCRSSNDGNHWVKCDSFEELPLQSSPPEGSAILQKMCISTFVDKHVRTASVYDAVPPRKAEVPVYTSRDSTVPYSTSSLGSPKTRKIIVKRSPSFNVCSIDYGDRIQKPIAKTNKTSRKATRIGVSSLSREQRLPLSLFDDRKILGSEPNLYSPLPTDHLTPLNKLLLQKRLNFRSEMNLNTSTVEQNHFTHTPDINQRPLPSRLNSRSEMNLNSTCTDDKESRRLQRCLNSRSEMSLNTTEQRIHVDSPHQLPNRLNSRSEMSLNITEQRLLADSPDVGCRQLSLPDMCSDGLEDNFPFIPPPPAYRNDRTESLKVDSEKISQRILDIHQLRQRSQDLELPLISALCNDRSLLMLPKTVPTCSRQRHLGNRTSSLPNGDGLVRPARPDLNAFIKSRPFSWHVDSNDVPQVLKPSSSSWDCAAMTQYPLLHDLVKESMANGQYPIRSESLVNGQLQYPHVQSIVKESSMNDQLQYQQHAHSNMTKESLLSNGHLQYQYIQNKVEGSLLNGQLRAAQYHVGVEASPSFTQPPQYQVMPQTLVSRTPSNAAQFQFQHSHNFPQESYMNHAVSTHLHNIPKESLMHRPVLHQHNLVQETSEMEPPQYQHFHHLLPETNYSQQYIVSDRLRTTSLDNAKAGFTNQYPVISKPRASSLDNAQAALPPTILTSFNKTPVRHPKCGSGSAADNYRYNTSQMIPMKLLATSIGNLPNGRLVQKGCSS